MLILISATLGTRRPAVGERSQEKVKSLVDATHAFKMTWPLVVDAQEDPFDSNTLMEETT